MNKQKFNLFLDKLLEKTEQEQIKWEKTADRATFLAVFKDNAIALSRILDNTMFDILQFAFRNEVGDIVDIVSLSNFDGEHEEFKKAEKIYNLAKNQPDQIDQTLDQIIEQLAA
ncbi:hypothetical protein BH20ACI4_BH20ACI4_25140 [soil metagenome]